MGKVYVVDENDEIIGLKERNALAPTDITRVSVVWITNSKGEILMAKRSPEKKTHGGLWSIAAGGMVDEGEDYDINVIKETEEELGLKLNPAKLRKGERMRTYDFPAFMQWYFYETDVAAEDLILQEEEVDSVRWYSKEELKREATEDPEKFTPLRDYWLKKLLSD